MTAAIRRLVARGVLTLWFVLSYSANAGAATGLGAELNLPALISPLPVYSRYVTGTVSTGLGDSRYELAFPFALLRFTEAKDGGCCTVDIRRIDVQLRRFSNPDRSGFYAGVVVRGSLVSGTAMLSREQIVHRRVGLGITLGFRSRLEDNVFWGMGLNVGRFSADVDSLDDGSTGVPILGPSDDGSRSFVNIEFLKLGYRF